MSGRKGTPRAPGRKVSQKTRGAEGRGRGMATASSSTPLLGVDPPTPSTTTPTSGRSGAMKRTLSAFFIEKAGGPSPAKVLIGDAGSRQGSAAQTSTPLAVEVSERQEEGASELSSGVSFGGSFLTRDLSPETRDLLEDLTEQQGNITLPAVFETSESGSASEGGQEEEVEVVGGQEMVARTKPRQTPLAPATPQAPSLVPSQRHDVSAPITPQGVVHRVPPAVPQRGYSYSSAVWDHFQISEEDVRIAICQHCKGRVSRGRDVSHLSTTGLRSHLEKNHAVLLQGGRLPGVPGISKRKTPVDTHEARCQAIATTSRAASLSSGAGQGHQRSLLEMFGGGGFRMPAGGKKKASHALTWSIAQWITTEGLPFTTVESRGFHKVMQMVAPWYTPPSRKTVSDTVLPKLYTAAKEYVRAQLNRAAGKTVHFTSDIWTSGAHDAFLSLTAHWWDTTGIRGGGGPGTSARQGEGRRAGYCRALLSVEGLDSGRHTADKIASSIQSSLDRWVGEDLTRGFLVTDGGRNMRSAAGVADMKGIYCSAHLLHLVVKDALGLGSSQESRDAEAREFRQIIAKCRAIAGHFSRSVVDDAALSEKQTEMRVPKHALFCDIETRWNSTCAMLERLVEQRTVLEALAPEVHSLEDDQWLSDEEWLTITQTVEALRPFKGYTELLSSDLANLGMVIPLVHSAREDMAQFVLPGEGQADIVPAVRALVRRLQAGVEHRFHAILQDEVYMLATMCDPRIKGRIARRAKQLDHFRETLSEMVSRQRSSAHTEEDSEEEGPDSEATVTGSAHRTPTPQVSGVGVVDPHSMAQVAVIGRWFGPSGSQGCVREDTAAAQVKEYLTEAYAMQNTCPLRYWASKEAVWPDLSAVAQQLLSCPPTSVPSERVFSHAGNIVTPHRSCTRPSKVDQLVFLKVNNLIFDYPDLTPKE